MQNKMQDLTAGSW